MYVVVSYDIVDTKKRTQLAKRLLNFGKRVQYSVFECQITRKQIKEMKEQTLPFIDLEKDSLRLYTICDACVARLQSFGIKKGWEEGEEDTITI